MDSIRNPYFWNTLVVGAALVLGVNETPAPTSRDAGHADHALMVGNAAPEGARPSTTLRRLSCEPLPEAPGKVVTTAIVEFPPHAYTLAHRHPGSVQAFVLRGSLRSQLAGGAARTYRSGESWFEPYGTVHSFAENPTADPAELLAVFITEENCGPLVIPE